MVMIALMTRLEYFRSLGPLEIGVVRLDPFQGLNEEVYHKTQEFPERELYPPELRK